ncbi:MAG: hypothetical protein ACK5M9_07800, partial [Mycobacterium sp.]
THLQTPPPAPAKTTARPAPVTTTAPPPPNPQPAGADVGAPGFPAERQAPAEPAPPSAKMTTEWLHVPLIPVPIPIQVPVGENPQDPGAAAPEPQNPFRSSGN